MKKLGLTTGIPPLILIGTLIVIFPIFTFMTLDRVNRQKDRNIRLLLEKGSALTRAFEAAAYTGMAGGQWSKVTMENLLSETAALPDIVYLFVVNKSGRILVHSDPQKAGQTYGRELDLKGVLAGGGTGWRILDREGGGRVFEMYKPFSPLDQSRMPGGRIMAMHGHMHAKAMRHADSYEDTIIFVGLDMQVIAEADRADTLHAVMMAAILALIGFSGFVLVFMVQRYAQARSSLSRIRVFSESLVENMPMGLVATDTRGRIASVNPAAALMLNLGPDPGAREGKEALPREINALLASMDGAAELKEEEIRLRTGDGSGMVLEAVAAPLRDREKGAQGTLLLLRDKTELSRLKNEMEENRRLAAIGRLAAGVAHEIRNPLSSLKGYATFFKEVFERDSENFEIADVMIKEVDRLNRVVSELVELARPVAVSGQPVDLAAVVDAVAAQLSYEKAAEGVDIETRVQPDLPRVTADADRMRQVLLNLGLNALEAMEDRGGRMEIGLKRAEGWMRITVSDTGCGITESRRREIFEPYFTTKLSGTGLGLAIVNNIVKAHKGRIEVESTPGEGTVFTVSLPL